MIDFYAIPWTGSFQYTKNPRMPLVSLTATFQLADEKTFNGRLTETPLILPADFQNALDVPQPNRMTPWGSIEGAVIMGEFTDRFYKNWGQEVLFVKTFDQLSGYPVYCRGAYNSANNMIVGKWHLVEGDTPCDLPHNLKSGDFTFRKYDGHRKPAPLETLPVTPELELA